MWATDREVVEERVTREAMRPERASLRARLIERFEQAGYGLNAEQIAQFVRYAWELQVWNQRINLTRITDDEGIVTKHFLDSLCALPWLAEGARVLDVGTGAGFPGLPLAIYRRDLRVTLMESIAKKVRFLKHLLQGLHLSRVELLHGRAEAFCREVTHREHYDSVVTRYVAALEKSARYCLPLVRPGGLFIAYKGSQANDELRQAEATLRHFRGNLQRVVQVHPTRTLVLIQKE